MEPLMLTALLKAACEMPHLRLALRLLYKGAEIVPGTEESRDELAAELEEAANNVPVASPEGFIPTELAECVIGYTFAAATMESVDIIVKQFGKEVEDYDAQKASQVEDFQDRFA